MPPSRLRRQEDVTDVWELVIVFRHRSETFKLRCASTQARTDTFNRLVEAMAGPDTVSVWHAEGVAIRVSDIVQVYVP